MFPWPLLVHCILVFLINPSWDQVTEKFRTQLWIPHKLSTCRIWTQQHLTTWFELPPPLPPILMKISSITVIKIFLPAFPMLPPCRNIKKFRQLQFFKSFWHGKSIVLNGETYILNDTAQFSEDMRDIYI